MRDVGDEVLPHAVEPLELREIVEHEQHAAPLAAGQAGRGGSDEALARRPQPEFPLDDLEAAARLLDDGVQLRRTGERRERRSRGRRHRGAEHGGQGAIAVHHAAFAIHQRHAVAHVREHELALVALALQRFESRAQLQGHVVDRPAQAPDLVARQLAGSGIGVAGADLLRHRHELAHARRLTARHPHGERHAQQQRHESGSDRVAEQRSAQPGDLGGRLRQPDDSQTGGAARGDGQIDELARHGGAHPGRLSDVAAQGLPHLGPRGVVLDERQAIARHVAVSDHAARGIDQRDAQSQEPAQLSGAILEVPRERPRGIRQARLHRPRAALEPLHVPGDQPAALLDDRQRGDDDERREDGEDLR